MDGIWLAAGITKLAVMWSWRNGAWLRTAGAALGEEKDTAAEAAAPSS